MTTRGVGRQGNRSPPPSRKMKPETNEPAPGLKASAQKSAPASTSSSNPSANALHPLELLSMRGGPMSGDSSLDPGTMPASPSWVASDVLKRRAVVSLLQRGLAKTREETVQMVEDEWSK